jgi:hypothetical protein
MSLKNILAAEGITASSQLTSREEILFEEVVEALLEEAKAPRGIRFTGLKNQEVSVPVPKGFDSLFGSVSISLKVSKVDPGNLFASVQWHYDHPYGGTNGGEIGNIHIDRVKLTSAFLFHGSWYRV